MYNAGYGNGSIIPNVDLTNFNSTNPRSQVRKCQKFFQLYAIPAEQKIDLTSLYIGERAYIWFQGQ